MSEHTVTSPMSDETEILEVPQVTERETTQQPSDEQFNLQDASAEILDIDSSEEIDVEGFSDNEEDNKQDETLVRVVDEPGDGPDVKEGVFPSLEPVTLPEAGEGQNQL